MMQHALTSEMIMSHLPHLIGVLFIGCYILGIAVECINIFYTLRKPRRVAATTARTIGNCNTPSAVAATTYYTTPRGQVRQIFVSSFKPLTTIIEEDSEEQEEEDEEVFYDAKEYEYELNSRCSTNNSVRRRRPPKRTTFRSFEPLPTIAEEDEEEPVDLQLSIEEENDEDKFFDAEQYEEQDEDDEFYDAKEYELEGQVQQVSRNKESNSMPRQRKPLASIAEEHVWYECTSKKIFIYLVAEEPFSEEAQGEPLTPQVKVQLHETIKMLDLSPLATISEEPDEISTDEEHDDEEQDEIPLMNDRPDSESNDEELTSNDENDHQDNQDQDQVAPPLPSPPQQPRRSSRIAATTPPPPALTLLRRSPRLAHMPRVSYVGMC